jgi:hypothetical protein
MKCFQELGTPSSEFYQAELQDDGLYWLECPHGHQTVTCLQEQKFEVLFDLGANAILDGYHREAVSSFSACLERFYEFYISVVAIKEGIDEASFLNSWRKVSNHSERQLGAFIFLYLLEEKKTPPLLSENSVKFRNDVVHKGKIPSKDEAISYGEEVLGLVTPLLRDLKAKHSEHVGKSVSRHVQQTRQAIQGNPHVSFLSISTTISVARANSEPDLKLKDTLLRLQEQWAKGRKGVKLLF